MKILQANNLSKCRNSDKINRADTSFGMKIIVQPDSYKNLYSGLDFFARESNKTKPVIGVIDFIKLSLFKFSKSLVIHNVTPKNHRLFNDNVEIKNIEVYYRTNLISDLNGSKLDSGGITRVDEIIAKDSDFGNSRATDRVRFVMITNNGVRVDTEAVKGKYRKLGHLIESEDSSHKVKYTADEADWVSEIHNAEIALQEKKNPLVYWEKLSKELK